MDTTLSTPYLTWNLLSVTTHHEEGKCFAATPHIKLLRFSLISWNDRAYHKLLCSNAVKCDLHTVLALGEDEEIKESHS